MADGIEKLLGNYRLTKLLGEGAFAGVYLGEHIYLKTPAAIKVLHTRLGKDEQEHFLAEARIIARLEHPHIVKVLEFGVENNEPFLVMTYAPNGSLHSLYPKGIPLPLSTINRYLKQIAPALQYVHDEKLIHRDIKPENILIGRNNEILLSDFGIAVVAHSPVSQVTQDSIGTPAYMAPEQLQGKPHPASDQYSLGIVVYEWLCGKRPFQGDSHALSFQHVHTPPPPLHETVPDIPPLLEEAIMKAIAKDIGQRFESIQVFADAIEKACQSEPLRISTHSEIDTEDRSPTPSKTAKTTLLPQASKDFQEAEQECFLCKLDSTPCTIKKLEGHIVSAHEFNNNGTKTPFIVIELGTEYASFSLTRYDSSLVKGLSELGKDLRKRKLILRLYHLPPPISKTEFKGRKLYRFRANEFTLAILEPNTILNITDLNHADYCPRQYLLNRLAAFPQSAAAIRGNLVHSSFKELLKEHDRGELMSGHVANGEETPLATLERHFEEALERNAIDLALANMPIEAIRADGAPHLQSLASWFDKQHATLWDMPALPTGDEDEIEQDHSSENMVRAETFLLAPEIGLRGRLDLLWRQKSRQRLLELKTGGASGELPKSAHRWQVQGYLSLLAVRRDPKMKNALATLLYSGTPGEATDFNLRFTIKQLQRVNETRNILVLSHITGIPAAPPGPSRCTKCSMLDRCASVSSLLGWQPPQPDKPPEHIENGHEHAVGAQFTAPSKSADNDNGYVENDHRGRNELRPYTIEDRAFFSKYYQLLQLEGLEIERQQALLWQTPVSARVEQGSAICNLEAPGKPMPTGHGEWQQTFSCVNTSELREGDEILLSDGDPITGEVVTGTILHISSEHVTIWIPELIAHPRLIDRYDMSIVHVRTLQNLLRWLEADTRLRQLVAGAQRPQFRPITVPPHPDLNAEQNLAVERALQMQDYLLIHGPPGTGKTSVIAEIVKQLCQQGQRVLLAAFTNQAVDNMLKRLELEGFRDFVRLGHARSVDSAIQHRLLIRLVEQQGDSSSVHTLLRSIPVVASTTATWSSEKYTPPSFNRADASVDLQTDSSLHFDVAIIDEAGQLTIPAILGALRFTKRIILVGDEKQLPPLVLSKEAAQAGLSDSLFSMLKQIDSDYTKEHPQAASACVALKVQYRMNKWISSFASKVFYEGQLQAHSSVASRLLVHLGTGTIGEMLSITRTLDPRAPLVFLDVQSEQGNSGEQGKISNSEARAVREVVAGLLARGVEEANIGIIAPYRAQVANLRRHLFSDDEATGWKALLPTTLLSVDTVDRFQGGERSVIIISFATTSTPDVESQIRQHLTNPNRLNVALTRAQRKLILVGHAPALESLPIFQRLLSYCRGMRTVITYTHTPVASPTTPR